MEKEFKLETILTIITGVNLNDNFSEAHELACYIYDDAYITPLGMSWLKNDMKEHLISLYPKLRNIGYVPISLKARKVWIDSLKEEFGKTLVIKKINEVTKQLKLKNEY